MNLSRVKPGDRVECNVRGRHFTATVVARSTEGLEVEPPKGVTYRHVTARQVVKVLRWDPRRTQVGG